MSDLEIETKTANVIDFADAELEGEIITKEPYIDEVLVYAEIGEEPDLSDADRIPDSGDRIGLSENEVVQPVASGLDADTTYYFRSKADAVDYDNKDSLVNAVESDGYVNNTGLWDDKTGMDTLTESESGIDTVTDSEVAMNKVSDSEIAMDKVTDKEMPMDKVTSKAQALGIFLTSEHIVDTHWSKIQPSEIFWQSGTPEPPHTFPEDGGATLDIVDGPTNSGKALEAFANEVDSRGDYYWYVEIDVTGKDELIVETQDLDNASEDFVVQQIWIDEDVIFSQGSNHTWTKRTFDISKYSGVVKLKFGWEQLQSSTATYRYNFGNVRLN